MILDTLFVRQLNGRPMAALITWTTMYFLQRYYEEFGEPLPEPNDVTDRQLLIIGKWYTSGKEK